MSKRKRNHSGHKVNAPEDWHEHMEKLTSEREQYQYMLEHGIHTDCTFVVGPEDCECETREFRAHRLHIARVSPVFEAMLLRGAMSEAKTGHVRVTDLSPHTFQLLLSSIYGEEPDMTTFQEAQDLTYAAHKYQIKFLLETCVKRMSALIAPENIWAAFETADLLQNECLKKNCLKILQRKTLQSLTDAGFMQASEENVALLLQQDELNVDDEPSLINMVVHWARREAQQRGLNGDDEGIRAVLEPRLLSLFRFLAMSPQQFMLGPGVAGWLTKDEKSAISECLRSKDCSDFAQHLSTVTQKRNNSSLELARTVQQTQATDQFGNLICKREIIRSRPNSNQTLKQCCLYKYHVKYLNEYYHCLHTRLIFKVSSSCKWLGFQCASRCRADTSEDHTAFEAKNPIYREKLVATAFTFNHTLSTDFKKSEIAQTSYEQQKPFNSTISVMFKEPVKLVPDNWFALEVVYKHFGSVVPPGEYPNPYRDPIVRTAAGVDFVFHVKEKKEGYHKSLYGGVFEALIFSL